MQAIEAERPKSLAEVVTARLRGDIEGTARLELHDRFGGCELRLVSSLAPHSPVLRAAAAKFSRQSPPNCVNTIE